MTPQLSLLNINQSLDEIKRTEQDLEYWSARELMPLLGYVKWQKFLEAINRAKESCKKSDQPIKYHFTGAGNMITVGKGASRRVEDILLTRYACYLVAQNGDPRKIEIAQAQTYFAIQTRKQELNEQYQEENKRLVSRAKLKQTEQKSSLPSTSVASSYLSSLAFSKTITSKPSMVVYLPSISKKRGIPQKRALADFDTTVELKAKDFALAMTDHNIKEKNLRGSYRLNQEVVKNSKATRQTLLSRGLSQNPSSLRRI